MSGSTTTFIKGSSLYDVVNELLCNCAALLGIFKIVVLLDAQSNDDDNNNNNKHKHKREPMIK